VRQQAESEIAAKAMTPLATLTDSSHVRTRCHLRVASHAVAISTPRAALGGRCRRPPNPRAGITQRAHDRRGEPEHEEQSFSTPSRPWKALVCVRLSGRGAMSLRAPNEGVMLRH
jgi:hypothetical protein